LWGVSEPNSYHFVVPPLQLRALNFVLCPDKLPFGKFSYSVKLLNAHNANDTKSLMVQGIVADCSLGFSRLSPMGQEQQQHLTLPPLTISPPSSLPFLPSAVSGSSHNSNSLAATANPPDPARMTEAWFGVENKSRFGDPLNVSFSVSVCPQVAPFVALLVLHRKQGQHDFPLSSVVLRNGESVEVRVKVVARDGCTQLLPASVASRSLLLGSVTLTSPDLSKDEEILVMGQLDSLPQQAFVLSRPHIWFGHRDETIPGRDKQQPQQQDAERWVESFAITNQSLQNPLKVQFKLEVELVSQFALSLPSRSLSEPLSSPTSPTSPSPRVDPTMEVHLPAVTSTPRSNSSGNNSNSNSNSTITITHTNNSSNNSSSSSRLPVASVPGLCISCMEAVIGPGSSFTVHLTFCPSAKNAHAVNAIKYVAVVVEEADPPQQQQQPLSLQDRSSNSSSSSNSSNRQDVLVSFQLSSYLDHTDTASAVLLLLQGEGDEETARETAPTEHAVGVATAVTTTTTATVTTTTTATTPLAPIPSARSTIANNPGITNNIVTATIPISSTTPSTSTSSTTTITADQSLPSLQTALPHPHHSHHPHPDSQQTHRQKEAEQQQLDEISQRTEGSEDPHHGSGVMCACCLTSREATKEVLESARADLKEAKAELKAVKAEFQAAKAELEVAKQQGDADDISAAKEDVATCRRAVQTAQSGVDATQCHYNEVLNSLKFHDR